MPAQSNTRLDALTREIDLEAAIIADTRKKAIFEQEAKAAAKRIRANTEWLNQLRATLSSEHSTNGASAPPAPRKRRRSRKVGQRKIDFVIAAIKNLTKPEFTPGDILEELHRLYPEAGITRGGLSSLMWKLSRLPEGQKLFKQTAHWLGGRTPARYAKVEEVRTRTRGTTSAVPLSDLVETLAAEQNGK